EPDLRPRLAFDVQDLLATASHVEQRAPLVVLCHELAALNRHREAQRTRARRPERDRNARGNGRAVRRQLDFLARDDLPVVLDDDGHPLARIPALSHDDVRNKRAALDHLAWKLDALDLDVVVETLGADS